MPIEVGICKFDDGLNRVKMQALDSESRLEDCLCAIFQCSRPVAKPPESRFCGGSEISDKQCDD